MRNPYSSLDILFKIFHSGVNSSTHTHCESQASAEKKRKKLLLSLRWKFFRLWLPSPTCTHTLYFWKKKIIHITATQWSMKWGFFPVNARYENSLCVKLKCLILELMEFHMSLKTTIFIDAYTDSVMVNHHSGWCYLISSISPHYPTRYARHSTSFVDYTKCDMMMSSRFFNKVDVDLRCCWRGYKMAVKFNFTAFL